MADSTLTSLTAASTLDGAELHYVVQGGADRKATGTQIKTLVQGSKLSNFAATTSAELATVISDETGTGALVFANTPTLVTPNIGVATGTSLVASGVLATGANSGTNGQVTLNGSSSGSVVLKVAVAAGTGTIFQLPATNGTNNWLLKTDGNGVTSWVAAAGTGDMLAANNLSDLTSATLGRSNLGVAIGSNVLAYDAQLFSNIPQNSQSTAYTFVLTDGQKEIFHPAADTTPRTWTIPANGSVAYPVGTVISLTGETSSGAITLAITTDTLVWIPTGTTGSRTLTAPFSAAIKKVTSTKWHLVGAGIS